MNAFYWISNYLLEFLKLNIFIFGIFNRPSQGKKWQWIPSALAIILVGTYAVMFPKDDNIVPLVSLLLILNMFLALAKKKDVFLVILAFIVLAAIETVFKGITQMMCDEELLNTIGEDTMYLLLNTLTGICLLLVESVLYKKKRVFHFSSKSVTLVFMGISGMIFYLYPIQSSYGLLEKDAHMLRISLVGVLISSLIFLLICFINLKSIHERETYKEKAKSYEEYVEKQETYYKELLEKEKATKQFRHDILNHLACLEYYIKDGENERAIEYINEMTGIAKRVSEKVLTGNDTIDIIVADVFRDEKEVKLTWKGKFPEKVNISDMDLCILFSNLLKNALEATRGYDGDCKEVTVTVKGYSPSYFINIENPCSKRPERKGDKFFTSKKDKNNHGFGMLNIEQVLNKYGGKILCQYNAPFFQAVVNLENISINT